MSNNGHYTIIVNLSFECLICILSYNFTNRCSIIGLRSYRPILHVIVIENLVLSNGTGHPYTSPAYRELAAMWHVRRSAVWPYDLWPWPKKTWVPLLDSWLSDLGVRWLSLRWTIIGVGWVCVTYGHAVIIFWWIGCLWYSTVGVHDVLVISYTELVWEIS